MDDTSPEMKKKYHEMLMARSPQERSRMGVEMLAMSRAIVISSIKAEFPDISPVELKQKLFLRFYGNDFNDEQKKKILAYLAESGEELEA